MNFNLDVACISNTGKIRANNEDNIFFNGTILPINNNGLTEILDEYAKTSNPVCYAVFDGMGGESKGEKASFLAAEEFKDSVQIITNYRAEHFLLDTCYKMNKRICDEQLIDKCSMGTTAAIMYFYLDNTYICNIGDSRIYQLRKGSLKQLSEDHVVKLDNFSLKLALSQNLGISEEDMTIEPYISKFQCGVKDKYLICSDGLTDMVSEDVILRVLSQEKNAKGIVEDLLKLALNNGGKDNITIIVCEVK